MYFSETVGAGFGRWETVHVFSGSSGIFSDSVPINSVYTEIFKIEIQEVHTAHSLSLETHYFVPAVHAGLSDKKYTLDDRRTRIPYSNPHNRRIELTTIDTL